MLKKASEKSVLLSVTLPTVLTKNKCWLQQEVHTTLEIAQTLMQRVALLGSYAVVTKKRRPTNFLKLEFDKIAQNNIRFSQNRC